MRIALVAVGTRGDVHPMLELACSLERAGHRAWLCAPPDFADRIAARGIEARPLGRPIRDALEEIAGAIHADPIRFAAESRRFTLQSLADEFATLPSALEGADRVLGGGPVMGAPSVAEALGVPYRFVAFTPALFPSAFHSPGLLPLQSRRPWVNRLLWRLMPVLTRMLLGRALAVERARLGLRAVGDPYRHLLGERPILAADAALAPMPVDVRVDYDRVPCLHEPLDEALPGKLEAFLDAGPPPVYVGFGSMTDPAAERTTALLLEALDRLGVRALLSEGWAGLGRGATLPQNVHVVGPVCHARLFPRTRLIVHHGGAGTTTTAARAGVPQLVVPHVLDQFYFAERVWQLGVGPPALPRRRLGLRALGDVLESSLANEGLAERARDLAQRLAEERAEARTAVDVVTGAWPPAGTR